MDNRVYYGEYSLQHWIDLILKKNIILPDYQRYFVWDETKVETLIDTFRKKQFIPPVTIGAYNTDGTNKNLVLDGQQRITSILLAYLGLYPDAQKYKKAIEQFANDNDDSDDDIPLDNILEWNFSRLTSKGKSKEEILSKITPNNYKLINLGIDQHFLDSNFLGFSYLVPKSKNEKEQQRYYSSVFRNINIQGQPLLPQESRASLYFLDQDLVQLLSPNFCKRIIIKLISSEAKADFVRYLSLLSHYHKDSNEGKVARGYKQNMEKYYEEYIYSAINDDDSKTYGRFSRIFPNKKYEDQLFELESAVSNLKIPEEHSSIIDVDVYLFGLTYHTLFKRKKIDSSKAVDLKDKLSKRIAEFKRDSSHHKSPNNLGHLRSRIASSISIYGRFLINES